MCRCCACKKSKRLVDPLQSTSGEVTTLTTLPLNIRLEIWKRVHYKHFKELRLTCRLIRQDIDHHLGVSLHIDETEEEFRHYMTGIGIRHATVINYVGKIGRFQELLHPLLLCHLTIRGTISSDCFSYLMLTCHNLSSLTILFSRGVLRERPLLFPQPFPCLKNLKCLKCEFQTRKDKDLFYACDNLTALLQNVVNENNIFDISFLMSHKSPSRYLDELSLEVMILAHRNQDSLQTFELEAKDSTSSHSSSPMDEDEQGQRRATEMVHAIIPSVVQRNRSISQEHRSSKSQTSSESPSSTVLEDIRNFRKDQYNVDIYEKAEEYLSRVKWGKPKHLKKVNVSTNSKSFMYLMDFLKHATNLEYLKIEITNALVDEWSYYGSLIPSVSQKLTCVKLAEVYLPGFHEAVMVVDFGMFQQCVQLRHLFVSFPRCEMNHYPIAKKLTKLPKTLKSLELFWISVKSWTAFRLLTRFKCLEYIELGYTSSAEATFACMLRTLKWCIRTKITNVKYVIVIDFKIRFRNKRNVLKSLRKAVPISIMYKDREQTLLEIDTGAKKLSQHSIASISSG